MTKERRSPRVDKTHSSELVTIRIAPATKRRWIRKAKRHRVALSVLVRRAVNTYGKGPAFWKAPGVLR